MATPCLHRHTFAISRLPLQLIHHCQQLVDMLNDGTLLGEGELIYDWTIYK